MTVNDQRNGNSNTYTLNRVKGRLTKWTETSTPLSKLNGIPIEFGADLSQISSPTNNSTVNAISGYQNWQIHWDNTNGYFVVDGVQDCSNGPCTLQSTYNSIDFSTGAVHIVPGVFSNMPLNGWSDSYSANITIPPTAAIPHTPVLIVPTTTRRAP